MRFLSRLYRVISPVIIFSMVVGSATPVVATPTSSSLAASSSPIVGNASHQSPALLAKAHISKSGLPLQPVTQPDTTALSTVYLPLVLKTGLNINDGTVISAQEGGTVTSPHQDVAITFQPGGLPKSITAVIRDDETTPLPANFAWMGPKVNAQALWLDDNQPVSALDPEARPILNPGSKPTLLQSRYWATVSIRLQPGQETNDMLAIARLDPHFGKWEILPTQIDMANGVAVAQTERLGSFALIENAALWLIDNEAGVETSVPCVIVNIGDECIVDELDAGFRHDPARPRGSWTDTSCGAGGCYLAHAFWTWNRSNYEDPDLSSPWDGGVWTPDLPLDGYYYVAAWIPANNATTISARYHITHTNGVNRIVVNQLNVSGAWKPLGVGAYHFVAGTNDNVYLDDVVPETSQGGAQIGFDAVKFIYAGQTPPTPLDVTPPTIYGVKRWLSSGKANIRVTVTDDVQVAYVELIFNGVRKPMQRLAGTDIYELTVDVPVAQESLYQIIALDTSGNIAKFPRNSRLMLHGYYSTDLGQYNSACSNSCDPGTKGFESDPVNTDPSSGNFFYENTDLVVPGIGDTDILIGRAFNGAPNEPMGIISYTEIITDQITETPFNVHPEPFGPGWTFEVGPSLLIIDNDLLHGVQVRYPDGHTVNFAESGGAFTPEGMRVYDTLTKVGSDYHLKLKNLTEYQFDNTGRLTDKTDRNSNTITYSYSRGRLSQIKNSAGRQVDIAYNNPDGFISDISAPEGLHLHYDYLNGLLDTFVDARTQPWTYTYNNGRLESILTPKGHPSVRLTYDALGRVAEQTVGATEHYTFGYDDATRTTTITDTYGNPTVHVYDEQYRLVESKDADQKSEFYGYNANDQRISFQDREKRSWTYTYDLQGNRLTEDGPLGWHREWTYNKLDLPTAMTETVSVYPLVIRAFTFEYNLLGNLKKMCNPLPFGAPDCAEFTYNTQGLPTDIYDFVHNHTGNTYDPATGDLLASTNAMTETTHFGYDGLGRVITMQLPLGVGPTYIYTFTYDGNSNLLDMNGPLNYHLGYHYDPNGNLDNTTDPNNGLTRFGYDASENLIASTNQLTFTTIYTYNLMSELTNFQDPEGRVWNYDLDNLFRVTGIHGPENTHSYLGYDAVSNVISTTDAETRTTFIEFDDLNRPLTVTLNAKPGEPESADINVTTLYTYDLMGNVLGMVDALNHATIYQYDLLDRMIFMRDAEQQEWRYQYDPMGNLTALINPRPITTTFGYDGVYRPISQTENYVPGGPVDSHTNVTTQNEYDLNGNLINTIDPLGVVTHFTYNELDQLAQQIRNYKPGLVETAEINVTTEYDYDRAGNLRFVTDPRDFVAEFRYDDAFRLTDSFDYEQAHTHFDYDRVNNLLARADDNQHITHYGYDKLDRVISVTDPETHTVMLDYDLVGNLTEMVDANQVPTHFEVDALNRPVTVTANYQPGQTPAPDINVVTAYHYDRMGNMLAAIDPNGNSTTYAYDAIYRTRFTTDAETNTSELIWGLNNNLAEVINGNGHPTVFGYDELDRQISATNAETETTQSGYDPLGNRITLVEADDTVTRYTYDHLYRLATVTENYIESGPSNYDTNVLTQYIYDPSGNLAQFIDANLHITKFEHDGMGRVLTETNPLTEFWTYTYDGVGNPRTRHDANGALTEYTYYADDQLRRIAYPDDTFVAYTYDAAHNQLTAHASWLGTIINEYDALNRLTASTDHWGRRVGYDYDAAGNRTDLTYPNERVVTTGYDASNFANQVIDPSGDVFDLTRDAAHNITQIDYPNRTMVKFRYDLAERLTAVRNVQDDGDILANYIYTLDAVGNRVKAIETINSALWREAGNGGDGAARLTTPADDDDPEVVTVSHFYTYDPLHRLVDVRDLFPEGDGDGDTLNRDEPRERRAWYIYDRVGNRLQKGWVMSGDDGDDEYGGLVTQPATTETPQDDDPDTHIINSTYNAANQLKTAGNHTYGFGANGLRIHESAPGLDLTYRYDFEYRQVRAERCLTDDDNGDQPSDGDERGCLITKNVYDAYGRRVQKTVFFAEGDHDLLNPADNDGAQITQYLFDGLDVIGEYHRWEDEEDGDWLNNDDGEGRWDYYYRGAGRILEMECVSGCGDDDDGDNLTPSDDDDDPDPARYFFHHDGLGSVVALTNKRGRIVDGNRTDEYGLPWSGFAKLSPFTYTGQEFDASTKLYHFYAREYDASVGVWVTQDIYRGQPSRPFSQHRYAYVYSNPTSFLDPIGLWVESALDIAFIAYDIHEIHQKGWNWETGLSLAADIGGLILPGVTGGGLAVKAIAHADDVVDTVKVVDKAKDGLSTFQHASEYGYKAYDDLMDLKKGTGLEAHHLIEQRFVPILKVDPKKMLSIALTPTEHDVFTKAWRDAIALKNSSKRLTTLTASADDIWDAARKVYKDHPEILRKLGLLDDGGNLINDTNRLRQILRALGILVDIPSSMMCVPGEEGYLPPYSPDFPIPVSTPSPNR